MKTNFLYLIIIFLSFFITANSFSQNSKISGKVFDSDNKLPLNGVLIFLDGNYLSSSTNSFGEYSFAKLLQEIIK
ncbi:MAG: hypothetical protein IPP52_09705 [Ignavibacteria bacterium]|nr:hypothetical protein [Ignavibacteria bacterium]